MYKIILMKKKIAIIGAGIAGLTLANLIKKNSDFEFMLYEKEEIQKRWESYCTKLFGREREDRDRRHQATGDRTVR